MKSTSEKLFLDLPTMSAPSGEERPLRASTQEARCMVLPPLTVTLPAQSGSVTLMVLVFTASGPRVSGCPATRPAAGAPSAVPLASARVQGGELRTVAVPVGRFHVISKQQAEL